jgi:hypothetical protein
VQIGQVNRGASCLLEAVPPDPALATLDRDAYGFERAADHRFWGARAAQANLWRWPAGRSPTPTSTAKV